MFPFRERNLLSCVTSLDLSVSRVGLRLARIYAYAQQVWLCSALFLREETLLCLWKIKYLDSDKELNLPLSWSSLTWPLLYDMSSAALKCELLQKTEVDLSFRFDISTFLLLKIRYSLEAYRTNENKILNKSMLKVSRTL